MFTSSKPEIELLPKAERGVIEALVSSDHRGRVRAKATSWFAELYPSDRQMTISVGEPVHIIARRGTTTLLVLPIHPQ